MTHAHGAADVKHPCDAPCLLVEVTHMHHGTLDNDRGLMKFMNELLVLKSSRPTENAVNFCVFAFNDQLDLRKVLFPAALYSSFYCFPCTQEFNIYPALQP